MAGAPKGNKNAFKLRDPEIRQEAYRQYCAYLAQGKSKEGWKFVHPTDILKSLTHKTMEKYIDENPIEFPPILMEMAQADSFKYFEEEGIKLMQGKYKNGSPETWKTFMRNKFRWDRDMVEAVIKCSADKILDDMRSATPTKLAHYKKVRGKK